MQRRILFKYDNHETKTLEIGKLFSKLILRTSSLSVNNFPTSLSMRFGLISSPRAEFVKRYIEKRVKEWLANHA